MMKTIEEIAHIIKKGEAWSLTPNEYSRFKHHQGGGIGKGKYARWDEMTNEEYQRLIQAQMQGGQSGQHWNASPTLYGNTLGQSGSLGAQQGLAYAFAQQGSSLANDYSQQIANDYARHQAQLANLGAQQAQLANQPSFPSAAAQQAYYNALAHAQQRAFYAPLARAPAVKHEGIRAGEIIGYRCWQLLHEGGFLHSLTQMIAWAPGEPMQGDISQNGVYAFNLMGRAIWEMDSTWTGLKPTRMVTGTVQMWGEIVEHEHGYRSEFAKIASLDYIQGADESVLQGLRVKYGL